MQIDIHDYNEITLSQGGEVIASTTPGADIDDLAEHPIFQDDRPAMLHFQAY